MKKYFAYSLILLVLLPLPTKAQTLSEKLSGRILLQVESYGRAWYVEPETKTRYYLQNGTIAYDLMRQLSLGISNADLAKIPSNTNELADANLIKRVAGKILLQVENNGEAWYVNPADGLRYYMKDGAEAYRIMRELSLGISNKNLATIPVTKNQLVHDTTFNDVAYVHLRDNKIIAGKNGNVVLPPASMTKLMTALVLIDQPNFNKRNIVTITQSQLNYPTELVGDDTTSEVQMSAGDMFSIADLWTAMLVASSNQATIALVDSSGLTRQQFVNEMNNKTRMLGLTQTFFVDPTGLNAHNLTTATEMAQIAKTALSNKDVSNTTKLRSYKMTNLKNGNLVPVVDRNFSLQDLEIDGSKTGYLVEAERCVSIKKDNDIIVVMHARSLSERNNIILNLLK